MPRFAEGDVEIALLDWLAELGYAVINGARIAPGEEEAEREGFGEVVLARRLREALIRLNPSLPSEALEDAFRKVTRFSSPSLVANNRALHRLLVDGVPVEYPHEGRVKGDLARLIDFEAPANNDWLAVNQFTVIEDRHNRRPDVVLFLNGLPLGLIELKNTVDENATIWGAFNQLQTYKAQIPSLLAYNAALVISDGLEARLGSLTADRERFLPWRTVESETPAPSTLPQLEVLTRGVFERRRFLDLLRHFIVFEEDGGTVVKKIAGYHQFHAVNRAVATTVEAATAGGDRRAGVVWHTQGSGKSLTMAFFAGQVILHPALGNPTLVILTDRNDLDDQLFGTFSRCRDLLRQAPAQAANRDHLRELLRVASGGVVFTTIQKFEASGDGPLSDRRNIIVIADEAHRSQYDFIDGFARHLRDALPNATFIGFTGTPIELADKNTRAVFGDYVSVYDIQRAVSDGATVPIYYESRLARLELDESEKPKLDKDFEEATEGEETERKEHLKTKWAALEQIVGSEKRIQLIARDIVDHYEKRQEALDGKAMIVAMSRRICVDLYNALTAIHPEWHDEDDAKGAIKVVMTGSAADEEAWQPHIRNKARREALAKRFKDPADPLKIVIVRDMWLTGFDAPSLHTMYVDKPMRGHGLMQAIARVNRVYGSKQGGLIVDYLGLGYFLKQALAVYTESGGQGETAIDQEEAVAVMLKHYEICKGLFYGFNWAVWITGTPGQRLGLLPSAQEHILKQLDGKRRLLNAVDDLSKAFALAVPHPKAIEIRDDVGFFQSVRAALSKSVGGNRLEAETSDHAIRQIISRALISDQVVDIFALAGLKKPNLSILDEAFLSEVRALPQRNLAVELLRKLLNDEIRRRAKKSLVQSRSFAEMLERAIRAYQNRALETAQVLEELIGLAKEMKAAEQRGEQLNLSEEELAFYDALEVNDSAVKAMGDAALMTIARELTDAIRNNVTIDWTQKESVRAKLRVTVRRILKRRGYPPDMAEKATQTVLEQAELIARDWAN